MLLNVLVIKGHEIVFSQEAFPFWSFVLPTDAYVISRLTVAHFLIEFCNPDSVIIYIHMIFVHSYLHISYLLKASITVNHNPRKGAYK